MRAAGCGCAPETRKTRPLRRTVSARSSMALRPVASVAVMYCSRRMTTGGSESRRSAMPCSLSVAPNRNGPVMRNTAT